MCKRPKLRATKRLDIAAEIYRFTPLSYRGPTEEPMKAYLLAHRHPSWGHRHFGEVKNRVRWRQTEDDAQESSTEGKRDGAPLESRATHERRASCTNARTDLSIDQICPREKRTSQWTLPFRGKTVFGRESALISYDANVGTGEIRLLARIFFF